MDSILPENRICFPLSSRGWMRSIWPSVGRTMEKLSSNHGMTRRWHISVQVKKPPRKAVKVLFDLGGSRQYWWHAGAFSRGPLRYNPNTVILRVGIGFCSSITREVNSGVDHSEMGLKVHPFYHFCSDKGTSAKKKPSSSIMQQYLYSVVMTYEAPGSSSKRWRDLEVAPKQTRLDVLYFKSRARNKVRSDKNAAGHSDSCRGRRIEAARVFHFWKLGVLRQIKKGWGPDPWSSYVLDQRIDKVSSKLAKRFAR